MPLFRRGPRQAVRELFEAHPELQAELLLDDAFRSLLGRKKVKEALSMLYQPNIMLEEARDALKLARELDEKHPVVNQLMDAIIPKMDFGEAEDFRDNIMSPQTKGKPHTHPSYRAWAIRHGELLQMHTDAVRSSWTKQRDNKAGSE